MGVAGANGGWPAAERGVGRPAVAADKVSGRRMRDAPTPHVAQEKERNQEHAVPCAFSVRLIAVSAVRQVGERCWCRARLRWLRPRPGNAAWMSTKARNLSRALIDRTNLKQATGLFQVVFDIGMSW